MSIKSIIKKIRNSNDLVYLALVGIQSKAENKGKSGLRKNILPELVYLLDETSLVNLISYFEGETIYIPKASHVKDQLYGILAYYYYEEEGLKDWKKVIEKMELPYSQELESKLAVLKEDTEHSLKGIKLLSEIPGEDTL